MLINPAIQSYAAFDSPVGQREPGGGADVRSDIPPVKEATNAAQSKNGTASNNLFQPRKTNEGAVAEGATDNPESGQRGASETSLGTNGAERSGSTARTDVEADLRERAQQREDELVIRQLRARDQEVRVHEAAHAAVGGKYAGSPSFQFTRGPDGVNYATDGEVSISTGKVAGDPQATIEKARVIRAAALAPASPSAQDRRVAAFASQLEADARVELREVAAEERKAAAEAEASSAELEEEKQNLQVEKEKADDAGEGEVSAEPVSVAGSSVGQNDESDSSDGEEGSDDDSGVTQGERTTAKDRLEDILLSAKPIAVELNELGLVDAENPFGKSGFISLIA